MMPGYFDTSLFEAGLFFGIMLLKAGIAAIIAGMLTLPIFFLVIGILRSWFWALDAREGSDHTFGWKSVVPAGGALLLRWGIPIVSFAATLFLAGYFGLFDMASSAEKPENQRVFRDRYEKVTHSVAESIATLGRPPQADPSDPHSPEDQIQQKWDDRVKQIATFVRLLTMFGLILSGPFPTLVILLCLTVGRKGVVLIMRSLTRNLLRTSLTYLAVFILAFVVSAIWSALGFLDMVTAEKESNLKAIITEKFQIPSMMKPTHLQTLKQLIEELPPEMRPRNGDDDIMTWAFVGGTMDPTNRTFENMLFLFCMEPHKILTMMDGLDELTTEQLQQLRKGTEIMEVNPKAVVIGKERLRLMRKRVGDRFTLTSLNYPDLTFEFEIIGEFPEGRYDQSAVMNRVYLDRSLQAYEGTAGKVHPNADKSLNLIWVRMPDKRAFETLAEKVNSSGKFSPAVKMETASSAIGSFLEPFKDVLFFMRVLLAPALLATMVLVISNAITISVRERRTEMAVLKVLGFRPWMVMGLVLGESVLLGALSGFMATATAYTLVNAIGGLPFPIAFFPKFFFPASSLWWGPTVGAGAALLGSLVPALSARSVRVSEVFSKVA
jgi:putative ABC transport system permease protein